MSAHGERLELAYARVAATQPCPPVWCCRVGVQECQIDTGQDSSKWDDWRGCSCHRSEGLAERHGALGKLAEQDQHSAPGRGRGLSRREQISFRRSPWLSISPGSSRAAAGGGRRCWPGSGSGALRWRSTRRCLLHCRRTVRGWARTSYR